MHSLAKELVVDQLINAVQHSEWDADHLPKRITKLNTKDYSAM
jgi:hypothetical protein